VFDGHSEYLKIFYHKNHRDFSFCDCYGICYLFNKEVLDKEIPIYLNEKIYTDEDVNATYKSKTSDFRKIPIGKEAIGDIISFNIKGFAVHVGVVLQKGTMLHIMEGKHASIESYSNSKWERKVDSFWRYESTSKKTDIRTI
jgi:cell wall-associated NlpC family hydrolase